jgi:hypothetical protein
MQRNLCIYFWKKSFIYLKLLCKNNTCTAWLSSARAVRCSVNSVNGRNPRFFLLTAYFKVSTIKRSSTNEVERSWGLWQIITVVYWAGPHTCHNGLYNEMQQSNLEQIYKNYLSTDCSLKFESMKKESLVIADHNAAVNMFLGSARIVRHA